MSGVQSKICRLRGEKTIIIYETLYPLVSNFLGSRKARYGPMLHFLILWSSNASLSSAVRIQWYQLQAYAFLRLNYSFRAFASFMLIRAFTAVELKSYNTILAPLIYQKHLAAVVVKQKFFADLLQCTSIYRCAL